MAAKDGLILASSRWIRHLGVYLLYLLATVFLTWPLAAQLSTHLAGFEYGDSHEMARHIWWYKHALRSGQPVFFQPLLGYPEGIEGGVLLWANPQQFFPAWLLAFMLPLPAAANLSVLLYMALNGWAAYFLARYLLKSEAPALLVGLVYMAAPTFQTHLAGGHAGLMVAWPAPLYIWALLNLIAPASQTASKHPSERRNTLKYFALAVLFFVLSPGGHILQLIYVILPITVVLVLACLVRRDWGGLTLILAVNVAGVVLLGLYLLPIAGSIFGTSAYTDEGGFVRYSADLLSIVSPSFYHPLYDRLDYPHRVLGINLEEGTSYLGVIVGLLALVAVIRQRAARGWLLLALIAWVLSLGPVLKVFDQPVVAHTDDYETYLTLPWAFLQNLPGFSLARTPGRFNFALALAVAVLAGYGARELASPVSPVLWKRTGNRGAAAMKLAMLAVLAIVILLDYRFFWPFPTTPAALPPEVHALAAHEDLRAVFDIPWENTVAAKEALYLQTAHQKALVAGHVTRSTPVDPAKLTLLQGTLDPVLLDAAGAGMVIVHKRYATPEQVTFAAAQLGTPYYEDAALAVYEVPAPDITADPPRWLAGDGVSYYRTFAQGTTQDTPLTITARHPVYFYAPLDGWTLLRAELSGDGHTVDFQLDGRSFGRWKVEGGLELNVPLYMTQGYHTLTLVLDPPCSARHSAGLRCRAMTAKRLTLSPVESAGTERIAFANGITLDYAMPPSGNETNFIWLWWQFEQPPADNAVRFVHILNAEGEPVAQFDSPLDTDGATQWGEQIVMELPVGEYHVYAGWYSYPDITRYAVLSPVEGAGDGWALLGRFTLG